MNRLRTLGPLGLAGILASAVLLANAAPTAQATDEIRLASLTPDGSVWDKQLRILAAEWTKALDGKVKVNVYPNGALGDDPAVATGMMRLGRPNAAALTVLGLAEIDPAFNVFSMPFFYASFGELYAVMDKMTPLMTEKLDKRGVVLLAWGHGGWAQVFTTRPVKTVAEMRTIKLFTSAGDQKMENLYRSNGFKPQPLEVPAILTSLESGLIEGLPSPATAALSYQWFRRTKYMLDLGVAPVTGALVISKRTWATIPEPARAKLTAAARTMETKLKTEIPVSEKTSIDEMKKRGLVVNSATGDEWKTIGDRFSKAMLDTGMVPRDVYDIAVRERDAFRQRK